MACIVLRKTFPETLSSNVMVRLVELGKLGGEIVNQWSDLSETIVALLSTKYQNSVFIKVLGELTEPVSGTSNH